MEGNEIKITVSGEISSGTTTIIQLILDKLVSEGFNDVTIEDESLDENGVPFGEKIMGYYKRKIDTLKSKKTKFKIKEEKYLKK